MSVLSDFFKGSDTQLGVFYPRDYVICVFTSMEAAEKGRDNIAALGLCAR